MARGIGIERWRVFFGGKVRVGRMIGERGAGRREGSMPHFPSPRKISSHLVYSL